MENDENLYFKPDKILSIRLNYNFLQHSEEEYHRFRLQYSYRHHFQSTHESLLYDLEQ